MNRIVSSYLPIFFNYFFDKPKYDLPNELWSDIMTNLKARDLMSCSVVSKRFNSLTVRLWKEIAINEKETRYRDLTREQQSLWIKRMANGCPFILGLAPSLDPTLILEGKGPSARWYKDQSLTVTCKQLSEKNKVVFKVIKTCPGSALISFTGLLPKAKYSSKAFLVSVDIRLSRYVKRLLQGNVCSLFTNEGEDRSAKIRFVG